MRRKASGWVRREHTEHRPRVENKSIWRELTAFGVSGFLAGSMTYYYFHVGEVVVTGRKRFMNMHPNDERDIGNATFRHYLKENEEIILSDTHPLCILARKVTYRLIDNSGFPGLKELDWDIKVVQSEQPNCFCLPSGKVIILSSIIPVAMTEAGLACILAHEIAHVLCRHSAERMSLASIGWFTWLFVRSVFGISFNISHIDDKGQFLSLPNSKVQELEADRIGLLIMARAGYHPDEAIKFWSRMANVEKTAIKPVGFLDTHPQTYKRIDKISKEWRREAMIEYEKAEWRLNIKRKVQKAIKKQ